MVAPAILAVFSLGYTVVAAGRLAQQHFAGALRRVSLSKSVIASATSRASSKVTNKEDLSDEENCQTQIASFDRHVKEPHLQLALTRPLFHECLSKGQVAWRDLSELSRAEQIKGLDGTLQEHGPQVAVVLPDLMLMFPSRMLEDFVNWRMTSHSSDQHVRKAWELLSDWDWTGEPDLPTLRLLLAAPRDETRLKAVQALGVLSRQPSDLPSVQTCLWMAMSDSSQEVRGAVAQTLVNLTSPDKNDKTRLELVLETVKKVLREDAESIWRGSKSKLILENGIADERAVATAVMVLEGLAYQHFGAVLPILKHAATSGKLRTRLRIVKAAATLCANDRTRKGALLPLLQNAAADVAPGVSLDARNALLFSCPPNL